MERDAAELDRWECGQSRVAILLSNCPAYLEAMIGAYRARAVPYNVNHHYNAGEVAALLAQIGADAVVYHRRLAPLLAEADLDGAVLIDVDDGSGVVAAPGQHGARAGDRGRRRRGRSPAPSPDDLYLVCTGGTTGRPKGVLWRQADIYVSAMGGMDGATAESITGIATNGAGVWFAAPPLMHAAAQWTVFAGCTTGPRSCSTTTRSPSMPAPSSRRPSASG